MPSPSPALTNEGAGVRPPVAPAHAGTLDVDIVVDLRILTRTHAYHTLEENLQKVGQSLCGLRCGTLVSLSLRESQPRSDRRTAHPHADANRN